MSEAWAAAPLNAPTVVDPATVDRGVDLPFVSIVVPAFNEADLLPACIAALRAQDYLGRLEIIVVDNASTDGTGAIAAALGARVVHQPHPGVTWARELGTRSAAGEIIVSTDADTTVQANWLTTIIETFREQPDLVAVCGPCVWVDSPWWGRAYGTLLFGAVRLIYRLTGRVLYASATNIAFKRDAWSGYDLTATQGGDEVGLLRQLRGRGGIYFSGGNATMTSPRRLTRGLLYNLLVTCLYYYLLGYVMNRLAGRTVIGTAPHIRGRTAVSGRRLRRLRSILYIAAGVLFVRLVT